MLHQQDDDVPVSFQKDILWSDESKLDLMEPKKFVWRFQSVTYNPTNTIPTTKYGGGSIIFKGVSLKKRNRKLSKN